MAPKIYHLHPLVAGPLDAWQLHLARCRGMGFNVVGLAPPFVPDRSGNIFATADFETLHPGLRWTRSADEGIARMVSLAAEQGLQLWLDISLDRLASADRLIRLAQAGVAGFRCLEPASVPAATWRCGIAAVHAAAPECRFLAWTPGMPRAAVSQLQGTGFDHVCSSLAWWDGRARWLVDEADVLRRVAPIIAAAEPSFAERRASRLDPYSDISAAYRHALRLAAATASGIFVPMGFEYATRRAFDAAYATPADFDRARDEAVCDLSAHILAANAMLDKVTALDVDGAMRMLSGFRDAVTVLLRTDSADARVASHAVAVLINPDLGQSAKIESQLTPLPPQAGTAFGMPVPADAAETTLSPGEVRILEYAVTVPIVDRAGREAALELPHLVSTRIAIEAVQPSVPDGDFVVKRLVGESVTVSADIFADGHEQLTAAVLWRAVDETEWHEVAMHPVTNDRWEASFIPSRIGRHQFTIEAWWDVWGTFRHNLSARHAAGQNVELEIAEGVRLLEAAAAGAAKRERTALRAIVEELNGAMNAADRVALMLSPDTQQVMQAVDDRPFRTRHAPPVMLSADRPQAAFASWYEMFPRSATDDPSRHGTFADVINRLPAIRAMGFDVLYFPPIHPIGLANRKGRNNALHAEPGDLGSPYAIGSADGGHDAIHLQLGTLEDFQALIAAARDNELEIALDFAIQCSPDHPWLREHPDWFQWRPDGTIRYAENPPKRYEDIVNPDFYAAAAVPDLWLALRDVVRFWIAQGVRIFRVDNPHTKPLPFWYWMIGSIACDHPDVIFLAESFTRPKPMYRLAKVGFTQSYTYFTWRNSKREIIEYLTELNAAPVRDFFRPNFFVNTPDINPPFLQQSGRPGFLIRAALACTLSGLWGMYSGFELCESEPLPGREEYLDSEKYQIRVRDFSAPGTIIPEITALNRIRRSQPALQSHLGVTFYSAANEHVLFYGKRAQARREMILVAVNLDPHAVQEAAIELPLWEFGLPDDGAFAASDLMRGDSFRWQGKNQRVILDPADMPFSIWHVAPPRGLP